MKSVFHKLSAVAMAVVVLMTTMSFTVDMHYCGDTMVDFSFFKEAKTCGMEKMQADKPCETPVLSKKSCCSDKQIVVEGQDDFKISIDKITPEQHFFVVSFLHAYIQSFDTISTDKDSFVDYTPPFIRQDAQVLHQTFLI